jgi:hypothetical protein
MTERIKDIIPAVGRVCQVDNTLSLSGFVQLG